MSTRIIFDPALMRATREAFDGAATAVVSRFGLSQPASDEILAKLSRHIVGLAKQGECDAERLRERALSALHFG